MLNTLDLFLKKLGISVEILNKFEFVLNEVPIGFVCELRSFCHSENQCISHIFTLTGNEKCNFNESSVRRKIKDSVDKVKKIKKNKNKNVQDFLESLFKFPERRENTIVESFTTNDQQRSAKQVFDKTKEFVKENKYLKRKLEEITETLEEVLQMYKISQEGYENIVEHCNDIVVECTNDLEISKPDSEKLKKSLQKLENKYEVQVNKLDSTIKELCETKEKLGKYNTRNVNKKLKRKNGNLNPGDRK